MRKRQNKIQLEYTNGLHPANPYAGLLRGHPGVNPMPAMDGFVDHDALAPFVVDPRNNPGAFVLGCINAKMTTLQLQSGQRMRVAKQGDIVASMDDRPIVVVAGTRQGKGTSVTGINAFWPHGLAMHDPKLEAAELAADYRTRVLKQSVHVLDPTGVASNGIAPYRSSCNMLAGVDPRDVEAIIRRATLLAEAGIVPESSRDAHWVDNARDVFRMCSVEVMATESYEVSRHLGSVYDLTLRLESAEVKKKLKMSKAAGGFVMRSAHVLYAKEEREFSAVLSTLRTALDFMNSPAMRRTLCGDGFHMADLPRGNLTIFYGVSPGQQDTCRGFLRLITAGIINAFEESDLRRDLAAQLSNERTLILIEEAGSLGSGFGRLENAAAILSGYGARLVTVWQDISQMKAQMGDRWETMFANAGVQIFFGNTDLETSEYISRRLGSTLVYAPTMGTPTHEAVVQQGVTGQSYGLVSHPLMTPREIAVTFAREDPMGRMLCFIPGSGPAILTKAHFHSHEAFEGMVDHAR